MNAHEPDEGEAPRNSPHAILYLQANSLHELSLEMATTVQLARRLASEQCAQRNVTVATMASCERLLRNLERQRTRTAEAARRIETATEILEAAHRRATEPTLIDPPPGLDLATFTLHSNAQALPAQQTSATARWLTPTPARGTEPRMHV